MILWKKGGIQMLKDQISHGRVVDVLTTPKEMLNALQDSKANHSTVGINSPMLGSGTFLTCVTDIIVLDDLAASPTIVLVSYDVTGYFLPTNILKLEDISSVCPFISKFNNPFVKNFERAKA
jgi:hypothetical protein